MIALNTQTDFHGSTYEYPTPNHGKKTIGVTEVLADQWAVCWITDDGARHRVNTSNLPACPHPDGLQKLLDIWAAQRGLRKSETSELMNAER